MNRGQGEIFKKRLARFKEIGLFCVFRLQLTAPRPEMCVCGWAAVDLDSVTEVTTARKHSEENKKEMFAAGFHDTINKNVLQILKDETYYRNWTSPCQHSLSKIDVVSPK